MKHIFYTLDAFAKTEEGGNPAGVYLNADHLDDEMMQKIAHHVGLSETAFIMKSDVADFKIRFFTPLEEVNLCGHATIASFYLLYHLGILKEGSYRQETKAGLLSVEIKDGFIWMEQAKPLFYQIADKDEVALSLGILVSDFLDDLPLQVVSTGINDLMVPIKDLKTLLDIKPNMQQVALVSQKYRTIGYHLFTLETYGATAHTRSIAPLIGIDEEAATGTANGALGAYLYHYQCLENQSYQQMTMEQGYVMNRPSLIQVKVMCDENKEVSVYVGGIAKNIRMHTYED